jgi:demethylmenaquinone methyltransferase/2-methoxy-6-polyprenyl-1,4-benzoquinol methylase
MKHFITKSLNLVASFYDPFLKLTMDEEKFRHEIIELANLNGNGKILDIGCGTGTLDLMIAEILNSGSIQGIDVAPKMIEVARKKAQKKDYGIGYQIGSSIALPYEDNYFDAAFTTLLFHHLNFQEKGKTLREISRVLKEDGKYIAAEFGQFPDDLFHGIILKFSRSSGLLHGLYPTELIGQNNLHIEHETNGPLIGGDHKVIYRVLKK